MMDKCSIDVTPTISRGTGVQALGWAKTRNPELSRVRFTRTKEDEERASVSGDTGMLVGCRWDNEMTFCSPFPPTAVASSRQRQERGKGAERDGESEKEGKMTGGQKKGWEIAAPDLCLCLLPLSPALQLLLHPLFAHFPQSLPSFLPPSPLCWEMLRKTEGGGRPRCV